MRSLWSSRHSRSPGHGHHCQTPEAEIVNGRGKPESDRFPISDLVKNAPDCAFLHASEMAPYLDNAFSDRWSSSPWPQAAPIAACSSSLSAPRNLTIRSRRFRRTTQTGRKNSATLTLSAFASFVMVASEGLRLPRRIWDKWPFEKSVSK
jgi:hypothetical protein